MKEQGSSWNASYGEWRPAETAPLNTWILVALARANIPTIAIVYDDGTCWTQDGHELFTATHWMPLPGVPQ